MKVGVIGSGDVGKTLAKGFLKQGYEVKIGTRNIDKLKEFASKEGKGIKVANFSETAKFADIIVLAVKGTEIESVINLANPSNFKNKIVIDVTNPLKFDQENTLPKLSTGFPNSLGLKIQQLLPTSKVVKAFNTVTANYMTNAKLNEGSPDMFIAGNDKNAKEKVKDIASKWSWTVIDMGNIEQAYLLEALAMLWITYGFINNHWTHAFKLLKR